MEHHQTEDFGNHASILPGPVNIESKRSKVASSLRVPAAALLALLACVQVISRYTKTRYTFFVKSQHFINFMNVVTWQKSISNQDRYYFVESDEFTTKDERLLRYWGKI